jgi:hypothetical protein
MQIAEDPDFKTPEPLIAVVTTGRLPRRAHHRPRFFVGNGAGVLRELAPRPFPALSAAADGPEPWA